MNGKIKIKKNLMTKFAFKKGIFFAKGYSLKLSQIFSKSRSRHELARGWEIKCLYKKHSMAVIKLHELPVLIRTLIKKLNWIICSQNLVLISVTALYMWKQARIQNLYRNRLKFFIWGGSAIVDTADLKNAYLPGKMCAVNDTAKPANVSFANSLASNF